MPVARGDVALPEDSMSAEVAAVIELIGTHLSTGEGGSGSKMKTVASLEVGGEAVLGDEKHDSAADRGSVERIDFGHCLIALGRLPGGIAQTD